MYQIKEELVQGILNYLATRPYAEVYLNFRRKNLHMQELEKPSTTTPTDGTDGVSNTSTGGTITTSGAYTIHTFTSSGTWTMVAASVAATGNFFSFF